MHRMHIKSHYVGGLLSLLLLPLMFFLWNGERVKRPEDNTEILVTKFPGDIRYTVDVPEVFYMFTGKDDTEKLSNLKEFCERIKVESDTIYRARLPEGATYGFFIQVIDLLRQNHFECGIDSQIVAFGYHPSVAYAATYKPATLQDEWRYVASECSTMVYSFKKFVGLPRAPEESIYRVHYSQFPPPDRMFSEYHYLNVMFYFPPPGEPVKEAPRTAAAIRSLAWWHSPIMLLWVVLFVLSVRRSKTFMR